tara:strand:- start:30293 stop:31579 length:1287 start_codon:yes stop_codon:yes gene_type:complete
MMPYNVAEVIERLGGFYRSSEIDDSDYDMWVKALEKTGRIIPYDKLPPDMQVNIRFQTDTQYRDFALNEWLEPKSDGLSQFGFNSPIQSHNLHWRWDKEGDMWYFRVLFPFEPVVNPWGQNKTFFESPQSSFNNELFELGERVAKDFFDAKGMGYGSDVFLGDFDSGVMEYFDEIGFSNLGILSHGHDGDMRQSELIKTEVYVAKSVMSGVKNPHDEAFLSEGFSQLKNFFKLIETKDGFFMPQMKSCSFTTETNNVIVYDEESLNNRENGLFMYLPSIQVKGRLYFESGYEHEGGFKRDLPIYPQRENSLDADSPISDKLIQQVAETAIYVGNKGTLEQYVFLGGMMHDSALQKHCVHCWIDGFKGNRGCSKCENDERYAKPNQHKIEIRVLGADFDDSMKGMGIINHTIIGVTPRVIVADIPKGGV